jgi:hypothetical protein
LGVPGRVVGGGGVDSMLWFRLKRGGDGMKCCRKMRRRLRAHFGSIGRKRDIVRRCVDVDRRRGGTGEGKGKRQHQLD